MKHNVSVSQYLQVSLLFSVKMCKNPFLYFSFLFNSAGMNSPSQKELSWFRFPQKYSLKEEFECKELIWKWSQDTPRGERRSKTS